MRYCERCKKETGPISHFSFYNTSQICGECRNKERQRSDYAECRKAEAEAIKRGDYNFCFKQEGEL